MCILEISLPFTDGTAGIIEYIHIPIFMAQTIGLYGYVFSKKFLNNKVWIVVILITIIDTIYYEFFGETILTAGVSEEENLYVLAVAYVISVPAYIGLILYALPSNKIWTETSNKTLERNILP